MQALYPTLPYPYPTPFPAPTLPLSLPLRYPYVSPSPRYLTLPPPTQARYVDPCCAALPEGGDYVGGSCAGGCAPCVYVPAEAGGWRCVEGPPVFGCAHVEYRLTLDNLAYLLDSPNRPREARRRMQRPRQRTNAAVCNGF